jgi:hypothetical protein
MRRARQARGALRLRKCERYRSAHAAGRRARLRWMRRGTTSYRESSAARCTTKARSVERGSVERELHDKQGVEREPATRNRGRWGALCAASVPRADMTMMMVGYAQIRPSCRALWQAPASAPRKPTGMCLPPRDSPMAGRDNPTPARDDDGELIVRASAVLKTPPSRWHQPDHGR